jgi:hypothetical protein
LAGYAVDRLKFYPLAVRASSSVGHRGYLFALFAALTIFLGMGLFHALSDFMQDFTL